MRYQFLSLRQFLVVAVTSCFLFFSAPAFAAERVLIKYSVLRESISLQELSTFAQTGKLSNKLLITITLARQDPDIIRQYLTTPVKINPVVLEKVLNSEIGVATLDRLSQVVHPPSQRGDRQALRSAFVASASQDRQITLLEIIQNYPTAEVEIEGDRLEDAYRQLRRLQDSLQDILSPQ
ncbi:alpha/beta hydrolase [Nostocaceae cyanobacterium CENA369]|uniref:Alpha/beta hydrolase n=1 Tax=Dendronalium phyllosphericum CENA369 TaxID=1725256 RepID=A0A8J7I1W8_9NOST|nr:alpha/beta hydrolase [Dendronalium phyllosphericum]MBH8573145.1 alpha/beta hydrolase [Dendronalium phyllosphericum CENA369]